MGLVWKRLLLLGMFWKVELRLDPSFWPMPLLVPIRWLFTSFPLTGVMMLPCGITMACLAMDEVLFVVERACIIF